LPFKQGRFVFAGLCASTRWHAALSRLRKRSLRPNSAEKAMAVSVSCTRLASASVEAVRGSEPCRWHGRATTKPRCVSVLLHPLGVGSAAVLWQDWSRRQHRRACQHWLRKPRLEVHLEPVGSASPEVSPSPLSRAERAHDRLSWAERWARNACAPTAGQVTLTRFGVPAAFAAFLGLPTWL
jgi:hypothetical protein